MLVAAKKILIKLIKNQLINYKSITYTIPSFSTKIATTYTIPTILRRASEKSEFQKKKTVTVQTIAFSELIVNPLNAKKEIEIMKMMSIINIEPEKADYYNKFMKRICGGGRSGWAFSDHPRTTPVSLPAAQRQPPRQEN